MSFFTGDRGGFKPIPWVPGAREAFGQAGDYYRDLLSNDSETFNQFQQPELRRFREQTIPGLSEQFAGFGFGAGTGGGGLSGSGFRNAAVNAGTDLSERLGAIRAQLRQQGAAGLMNLGQQYQGQQYYQPGQPGLFDYLGQAIGNAGGLAGGIAGGNYLSSLANQRQQSQYNYGNVPGVSAANQGSYNPMGFLNRGIY